MDLQEGSKDLAGKRRALVSQTGENGVSQSSSEYLRSCSYSCGWAGVEAGKVRQRTRSRLSGPRNSHLILWGLLRVNLRSKKLYRVHDGFQEIHEPLEMLGIFLGAGSIPFKGFSEGSTILKRSCYGQLGALKCFDHECAGNM